MDWNEVRYNNLSLEGEVLPPDCIWAEWKDKFGNIEVARFKVDVQDHFYPPTKLVKEENIVAWRYKTES